MPVDLPAAAVELRTGEADVGPAVAPTDVLLDVGPEPPNSPLDTVVADDPSGGVGRDEDGPVVADEGSPLPTLGVGALGVVQSGTAKVAAASAEDAHGGGGG